MDGRAEVEREFNDLTKKIAQLESYRHQLDSLDTHGFETEAQLIRSKLRDVNAVSDIAHELVELRKKIKERHAEKEHFQNSSTVHRTHVKELEHYQKLLAKKIAGLEHALEEKDRKLHDHLKSDAEHHGAESMSRFERYRKLLEKKVAWLQSSAAQREAEAKAHYNVDVRRQLLTQQKALALRYKNMVHTLHDRYEHKLHQRLQAEVSHRLHAALQEKLAEEKKRLLQTFIHSHAHELGAARKQIALNLHQHYAQKERALEEQFRKREETLKNEFVAQANVLRQRLAKALAKRKQVEQRLLELQRTFSKKRSSIKNEALRLKNNEAKELLSAYTSAHEKEKESARQLYLQKERHLETEFRRRIAVVQHKFRGSISLGSNSESAPLSSPQVNQENMLLLRRELINAWNREKELHRNIRKLEEDFAHERAALDKKLILLKQSEDNAFDKRLHDHIAPIEHHLESDNAVLRRALAAAKNNQQRLDAQFKTAQESFAKERTRLESELVRLREQNRARIAVAVEAARAKERALYQKQFASDTLALRKKLAFALKTQKTIEEGREREITSIRSSTDKKLRATLLADSRLRKKFDREHQSVQAKMEEVHQKGKEITLQSKRLRAAVVLQRELLQKKFEDANTSLKAQQTAAGADINRERAALRKFCWRLHTRMLLLEKREKLLAQNEAKLQESLDRKHSVLRKKLDSINEKKRKALLAVQARAEKESKARLKALQAREEAIVAERLRLQKTLTQERDHLRKKFERMKALASDKAVALTSRVTEEALTLSHQEKLIDKYREKIAARYAQRNARLTARHATLEQREKQSAEKEALLHALASKERAVVNEKLKEAQKDKERAIASARAEASKSLEATRKELVLRFREKVTALKREMHHALQKRLEAVNYQNHEAIQRELARKEKELRPKLEREYQSKLKTEVAKRMAEVRKKKVELEKQLVARARAFLG